MSLRSMTVVLSALVVTCSLAGCGGADTDTLPKAMVQLLDDTTATLKGIKDVETARAAEPKLKELADRKARIDEQAKATKMSQAELKASDDKYAAPIQEAAARMSGEITRIAMISPEAAEVVAKAMGMR